MIERTQNGRARFREVADSLKTAIVKGELKPGQRLVEVKLCELFSVKRNTVREALRKLEHDGFVKITPNIGAVVAEFTRTDIEQVYDLLSVLEGLAVRLATPFITAEQIEGLGALIERMEATDKLAPFARYNDDLHTMFCMYSENSRLISITENLRLGMKAFGLRSFHTPGQIVASNTEHKAILEAIKQNKPVRAERIMRDHVVDAKTRLIKWMYRSL